MIHILPIGIICASVITVLQTVLSAETICKIVLQKIRKAQIMTVIRIVKRDRFQPRISITNHSMFNFF